MTSTITCDYCGAVLNVSPYLNADLQLICDDLAAKLAAAEALIKSTYREACYLRYCVAPECTSMETTSGVLSQLSNFMAGQRDDLSTARGLLLEAVQECHVCDPSRDWHGWDGRNLCDDWYERAKKEVSGD